MRYLAVLIALALAGCAQPYLKRDDRTKDDFQREHYECLKDAAPVRDSIQASLMIDRCMYVKGWRKDGEK